MAIYSAYNLTGMSNSTGIVELMQLVNNELMFNFFGTGILLTIFLISLFAFLNSTGGDAMRSLAGASFISFALSLLLVILNLIPNYIMYSVLVLAALSAIGVKNL